jgi:hypothetical protein
MPIGEGEIWTCTFCGAKSKPVHGVSEAGRSNDGFRILYPQCLHGAVLACADCQPSAHCPKCNVDRFIVAGETQRFI